MHMHSLTSKEASVILCPAIFFLVYLVVPTTFLLTDRVTFFLPKLILHYISVLLAPLADLLLM